MINEILVTSSGTTCIPAHSGELVKPGLLFWFGLTSGQALKTWHRSRWYPHLVLRTPGKHHSSQIVIAPQLKGSPQKCCYVQKDVTKLVAPTKSEFLHNGSVIGNYDTLSTKPDKSMSSQISSFMLWAHADCLAGPCAMFRLHGITQVTSDASDSNPRPIQYPKPSSQTREKKTVIGLICICLNIRYPEDPWRILYGQLKS